MIKRREMTMMMIMKAAISNRMSLFCFRGLMRGAREGRLIIITTTGDTEYSPDFGVVHDDDDYPDNWKVS